MATMLAACLLCPPAFAQPAQVPDAAGSSSVPKVRVGPEYTPGWDMMTPAERDAYRQKMLAGPTRDECRRMRDDQIKAAAAARGRGIKDNPDPRYEACD
jgi:hypothetical protein